MVTAEYRGRRRYLLGEVREARRLLRIARAGGKDDAKRAATEALYLGQNLLAQLRRTRAGLIAAAVELRASVMVEVHGSDRAAVAFARMLGSKAGPEAQLYRAVATFLEGR